MLKVRFLLFAFAFCGPAAAVQGQDDLSRLILEPVAPEAGANLLPEGPEDRLADLPSGLEDQYLSEIEVLRAQAPDSAALGEKLTELAVLYQLQERHQEAVAIFTEAIAVSETVFGERSLEQIPLHQQVNRSLRALNAISSIDERQQLIYRIQAAHHEPVDLAMVMATLNLADWETTAYFRENFSPGREARELREGAAESGAGVAIVNPRLRNIDRLYRELQEALNASGSVSLDIGVGIAQRIARLAYHSRQRLDYERDSLGMEPAGGDAQRMQQSYDSGRDALNYVVTLLRNVPEMAPQALAMALVDLGDWHLVYGRPGFAEAAYKEAYQVMTGAGYSMEAVDGAFNTLQPRRIPRTATHVYSPASQGIGADEEVAYQGYVDVSFSVDRLGNVVAADFADTTSETVRALLETQLKSMKFRPLLKGGAMESRGVSRLRFLYAY